MTLLAGVVVLVVWFALRRPVLGQPAWGEALLLLSALVLVPLGLNLLAPGGRIKLLGGSQATSHVRILALVTGTPLAAAYLLPQGLAAAALALPWFGFTGLVALWGGARVRARLQRTRSGRTTHEPPLIAGLAVDGALVLLLVGGLGALMDRIGYRPLGFSHDIILLTGVHFHHAGFTLPLLSGRLAQLRPTAANRWGAGLSLAGVPLVGVGIVATQLRLSPSVEVAAVTIVAVGGLLVAMGYLREGLAQSGPTSALWLTAGLALAVGMALAGGYGARFLSPFLAQALDFPTMRTWHGTLNAVGFGLAGLLGWRLSGLMGDEPTR